MKPRTVICFGVIAFAALMLCLPSGNAHARTLQEILSSKTIRLGTIPYPPMTVKDPRTGGYKGIWVDGPEFLFKQLGLKVQFVETTWATFPGGLQSNQFDVFVGGSFATPTRATALDFSLPIMYMGESVTIRKEDVGKYKSISDLDKPGITIATVLGTSGDEWAKEHLKHATIKSLDTGDLTQDSLEVLSGRANAAVEDAFKVAQVVSQHPDRLVDLYGDRPFYLLPICYAVAKGNDDLLRMINTDLQWMQTTGKWQQLAEPYKKELGGVFYADTIYKPFGGPDAKN